MAKKKETEEKIQIRQFKDKSGHFWVNFSHFYLNENNELLWASGESDNKEYRDYLESYIKRNKKTYQSREISPYINQKEYLEVVAFGKHSGKNVQTIFNEDAGWLKWCRDKYSFSSSQEKLKQEITEILK